MHKIDPNDELTRKDKIRLGIPLKYRDLEAGDVFRFNTKAKSNPFFQLVALDETSVDGMRLSRDLSNYGQKSSFVGNLPVVLENLTPVLFYAYKQTLIGD